MKRRITMLLCIILVAAAGCAHDTAEPVGSMLTAEPSPSAETGKSGENGENGETAAPGASGGTDEPSRSWNASAGKSADPAGTERAEGENGGAPGAPETGTTDGESGGAGTGGTTPFGELTLVKTRNGFELRDGGRDSPVVLQTLISPPRDGKRYAVQIARRTSGDGVTRFRKDAIVLDLADRNEPAFRVFPLFEAYVNDTYNVDSVTEAYGFLDADRLLYVAASGDDPAAGNFSYKVQTLDIRTGEIEVLFADIPGAPMDEFFARGWLTADKNTLVLNTYQTGKLWTFDLGKREVRQSERLFPHSWPFYLTVPSPDGVLFWYTDHERQEYRLHKADGTPVAQVAFPSGFDEYPPFRWTPDGRYAAYAYTRDQAAEHVISSDEVHRIAPQGIRFFDRRGKRTLTVETNRNSGEYVELAAWIDEGQEALLHFFKLDRSDRQPGEPPEKQTLRYERLRIDTGKRTVLQTVGDPAQLAQTVYVPPLLNGPLYRIDHANNRIYKDHLIGVTLSNDASAEWAWYAVDEERKDAILYRFDAERGVISAQRMETPYPWPDAIVHEWLVAGSTYIRVAPLVEE